MSDEKHQGKRGGDAAHFSQHTDPQDGGNASPEQQSTDHVYQDEPAERSTKRLRDRTLRREPRSTDDSWRDDRSRDEDERRRDERLSRDAYDPYEYDELAWQSPAPRSYSLSQAFMRMLPQDPLFQPLSKRARIIVTCVLAALTLFSLLFLGPHFTDPNSYSKTIAVLDQKKETVMTLTGASTGTSAAITLLPGDVATPIAEKLVDLSSDFLIVVGALYLEKYLLTILAFIAFYILVPAGCLLGIAALHHPSYQWRPWFAQAGARLAVFGIAIALVVPVSVAVSSMIESTYKESIDQTVEKAQKTVEDIEAQSEEESNDNTPLDVLVSSVTAGATNAVERVRECLNDFIESLAMMIVTSCVIPIVVLLLFIWLIRAIFGISIPVPTRITHPRSLAKRGGRH
ncbi:MAG: hypothetical protein Q4B54_14520 [Coriobacteriales bacterium]|nr:hypothetical protein [Coriobacteriales bacterium]